MNEPAVILDFETRSAVDLAKCGVEVYAESPTTSILCQAWAWVSETGAPAEQPQVHGLLFDPYSPRLALTYATPGAELHLLLEHVRHGGTVIAHNARFERYLWNMHARRYGWPVMRAEQMRCTMAAARALSFPGALGDLTKALRLPVEKDMAGHRLMLKLCKPRKPRKHEPQDALIWHDDPAEHRRNLDYCIQDVRAEIAVHAALTPLSPEEQATWVLDQRINDAGVNLDAAAIAACEAATVAEKVRLTAEIRALTGRAVPSPNATAKTLAWLKGQGVDAPNLQKFTVERLLKSTTGDALRALEIRQEAAKASTAKLAAMRKSRCADGRARGLLEYHGAGPGRWAGRRIQTQNMPRTPDTFEVADAENIFGWLACEGGARGVTLEYGRVLDAVSWSLRSIIEAAPGNEFLCADYSNIEGRALAWLAGETWKLDAFRAFDAFEFDAHGQKIPDGKPGEFKRQGPDIYKLSYSRAFGVPVESVTKFQRLLGKVQELALGYQGAHGAFLSMVKNYGIDLAEITAAVRAATPADVWERAEARYWRRAEDAADEKWADLRAAAHAAEQDEPERGEPDFFDAMEEAAREVNFGLDVATWAAVRVLVEGWRAAHPRIASMSEDSPGFWKAIEAAAVDAVLSPARITAAGDHIRFRMDGDLLKCRLPSGRCISYPYARAVREGNRYKLEFEGVNGRTRKWQTERAYGGLLAENVTQAAARDLLRDAMHRLAKGGFNVVMHVHDEILAEEPAGARTLADFEALMAAPSPWAAGLPVTVEGWCGQRYRK